MSRRGVSKSRRRAEAICCRLLARGHVVGVTRERRPRRER